jgi:hypothetical protein
LSAALFTAKKRFLTYVYNRYRQVPEVVITGRQNETVVVVGADANMYESSGNAALCKGIGKLIVSPYRWQPNAFSFGREKYIDCGLGSSRQDPNKVECRNTDLLDNLSARAFNGYDLANNGSQLVVFLFLEARYSLLKISKPEF